MVLVIKELMLLPGTYSGNFLTIEIKNPLPYVNPCCPEQFSSIFLLLVG